MTKRIAHTPGPWVAKSDPLAAERGAIYIHGKGLYDPDEPLGEAYKTNADVDRGGLGETEANARLMAASPRLLAALQLIEIICTESAGACRKRMGTRIGNVLVEARRAIAEVES